MLNNKRGQGLSTNAIILIVLGVVVLVILIAGFTLGWSKIAPFLSKNNVDTIANQCAVSCSTESRYDYTGKIMELNDGENEIKTTCEILAKEFTKYGIASCPSISRIQKCEDLKINGKNAVQLDNSCDATTHYDVSSLAKDVGTEKPGCCILRN